MSASGVMSTSGKEGTSSPLRKTIIENDKIQTACFSGIIIAASQGTTCFAMQTIAGGSVAIGRHAIASWSNSTTQDSKSMEFTMLEHSQQMMSTALTFGLDRAL
eukprot:3263471-Amphidinium_carterae.1